MAAPRGRTYTPTRGPLAGQTFTAAPGRTSGYYAYQGALARYKGYAGGYGEQRKVEGGGVVRSLTEFIIRHSDLSRTEARDQASGFWQSESNHSPSYPAAGSHSPMLAPSGTDARRNRKHRAMAWLADEGFIDNHADSDDAWDTVDY